MRKEPQKIVIIGGGAMGAALAYKLAKEGERVVLYEKLPEKYFQAAPFEDLSENLGHSLTSSGIAHQSSRSLRYMWERLDHDLNMVTDTRDQYLEIEQASGVKFMAGHPSLMMIHPEDEETRELMEYQVNRVKRSGAQMQIWQPEEAIGKLHHTFPALKHYDAPKGSTIVYEAGYDPIHNPDGVSAMINPAAYIRAIHHLLADMPNVELHYDTAITQVKPNADAPDKAVVMLADGTSIPCDKAVLSSGGWTKPMLEQSGAEPMIEETPKRVRWTDVLPADKEEGAQICGEDMPFIQAESFRNMTASAHATVMPATVKDARVAGVKQLVSMKTPLCKGADGLADAGIEPAESAEDHQRFQAFTGIQTHGAAQAYKPHGAACMITATPDKMISAGQVKYKGHNEPSPVFAISADSYAGFVLGGAAVNAIDDMLHERPVRYPDWELHHSPHRDPMLSEQASIVKCKQVAHACDRAMV